MNLPAFPMGCHVLPGFSLKSLNLPFLLCASKGTLLWHISMTLSARANLWRMCPKCGRHHCFIWQFKLGCTSGEIHFIPTQVLTNLGFVINSVTMTIQLTREKAIGLQRACTELLACSSPSIREVNRVIRKRFQFPCGHARTSLLPTPGKRQDSF